MTPPLRIAPYLEEGEIKPRLRGVSHALAFVASLVGCYVLVLAPASGARYAAGLVFGASLVVLFGVSALYHCPNWSPVTSQRLQRCDHAAIYGLIAGTFTPVAVLDTESGWGPRMLGVMWTAAFIGAGLALMGHSGRRGPRSALYTVLGTVSVPVMFQLPGLIGPVRVGVLVLGAVLYAVGAVLYVRRWPNPVPTVFGYHEIFHLLIIVSAGLHYAVIIGVLWGR